MKKCHLKGLLALGLLGPLLLSTNAYAKIVCWTNSDNIRECGNAVPPEYAQKKSQTLNEQGRTTEVKARAKTADEIAAKKALLAAEKAHFAETQRLTKEAAQREQVQRNYDQVLLSTYLTEKDIVNSRDRQTASINASIEITNITIGKLKEKLAAEKKKAANYERKGKALTKRMQQDISSLQGQIDAKNTFIQSKEDEKRKLHTKYNADTARFRELKNSGVTLNTIYKQNEQSKETDAGDTHGCEAAKAYYEKDLDNNCIKGTGKLSCMSEQQRNELLETRKFIMDEMCTQKNK